MAIQYFWRHPLAEQVREEGREEGRKEVRVQAAREAILFILRSRGIPVSQAVRDRVNACADLDQLDTWGRRAVHATDAGELFVQD
ncbi:hypothetical protein [Streptomyces sp. NPDC102462]|uniref:hypothetical protein n=1 Tax=Streptomyces sp. NPDC102462 TaxID=3366178 RepID=UPI003806E4F7